VSFSVGSALKRRFASRWTAKVLRHIAIASIVALPVSACADEPAGHAACIPVGSWAVPLEGRAEATDAVRLLASAARQQVVLLGEKHDEAEHHRWQLQVLAALHAQRPDMVIGFEMFPRSVQPALDRWVAGKLSEPEFLAQARWSEVWRFDARLYLPLFHFARMNRIPMLALDVEGKLVKKVGESGWAAIPASVREGVGDPSPPDGAYVNSMFDVYREHVTRSRKAQPEHERDPRFIRFMEAQLVRDHAMAEVLAGPLGRADPPLVVGVMGSGHLRGGHGTPHQLRALGVKRISVLLPFEQGESCEDLRPTSADALFGVGPAPAGPRRMLMGVRLDGVEEGAKIVEVTPGSPAEKAGLQAGDVITVAAGGKVHSAHDIITTVARQAPGTWLPLTVQRAGQPLEIVVRFPPAQP
jgi:uncharacterized iron-regulated protein